MSVMQTLANGRLRQHFSKGFMFFAFLNLMLIDVNFLSTRGNKTGEDRRCQISCLNEMLHNHNECSGNILIPKQSVTPLRFPPFSN